MLIMTKQYAKLTLYHGSCPKPWDFPFTAGFLGDLPPTYPKDKRSVERHEEANRLAMETVEKYINTELLKEPNPTDPLSPSPFGKGFVITGENLAQSEEEAKFLIKYAEEKIPKSKAYIELIGFNRAVITFYKGIKFNDWTEDKKDFLLSMLKKSGHVPIVDEARYKGIISDPLKEKAYIEEALTHHIEYLWNEALEFFSEE
jgi:hypothetical protein